MKKIFLFICLIILQVNAQEPERTKEAQIYSTTHNLRKEEIRNMMQKQPFVLDVILADGKLSGIGFFISNDGTALTSYHVVENAQNIFALIEGVLYQVEIIGYDEVIDVAALKVKNFQSHPLQLAKSDPQPQSKVSIFEKKSQIHGKVLQSSGVNFVSDILISQGLSGSPIFCGEVVCGIITSFQRQVQKEQTFEQKVEYKQAGNIGNAIATKVTKVAKNLEKMLSGENFKKKKFDFYVMDLQKYDSISLENTHNSAQKNLGVLVTHSKDENLQAWDIITAINSQSVNNVNDLQVITANIYANDETIFTALRGKETITISIP